MTTELPKTVMVVDDEPDVRDYLATILEDADFRVITAGDGEEALELIRASPPDFISLDLIMPRKSGHKLLYELKRDRDLARIPILIVTAHARDELGRDDLEDLLQNRVMSGPGTYLEKPVDPASYVRSIRRALGVEELEPAEDRVDLEAELRSRLPAASPEALRRALRAINKPPGGPR